MAARDPGGSTNRALCPLLARTAALYVEGPRAQRRVVFSHSPSDTHAEVRNSEKGQNLHLRQEQIL